MQQQHAFRQIFWQTWRDLVFVHWEVDPAALERLLPPELEPDLFEGKAYVALVPFLMTGIRSVWLPPIPGTARTLETNVRTYVRRRGVAEPIPAVWFFSLEAESTLAVKVARGMYGLPYFKARMQYEREIRADGAEVRRAESMRLWPQPAPARSLVTAEFASRAPFAEAAAGTLEHVLVERYALFATQRGKLTYACVRHDPYRIRPGVLREVDTGLVRAAGIPAPAADARTIVHHAADVTVRIGAVSFVS
ncbi:MAG: YqjF family protein [bacterium]